MRCPDCHTLMTPINTLADGTECELYHKCPKCGIEIEDEYNDIERM